jgi:glucosamine-phosphate N-acetyltransferase
MFNVVVAPAVVLQCCAGFLHVVMSCSVVCTHGVADLKSLTHSLTHLFINSSFDTMTDNEEYIIRPLDRGDHAKGYCRLLAQLTSADFTEEQFQQRFDQLEHIKSIQPTFIFVAEHVSSQTVVASAACAVELKFIHSNGAVGHIEDVVTDSEHRRKGLAKKILHELQAAANGFGCYKVILDCAEHNVPVYEKAGFVKKEIQMVKYFE